MVRSSRLVALRQGPGTIGCPPPRPPRLVSPRLPPCSPRASRRPPPAREPYTRRPPRSTPVRSRSKHTHSAHREDSVQTTHRSPCARSLERPRHSCSAQLHTLSVIRSPSPSFEKMHPVATIPPHPPIVPIGQSRRTSSVRQCLAWTTSLAFMTNPSMQGTA